jgi:lipopolysaccharide heptosyltransferase II
MKEKIKKGLALSLDFLWCNLLLLVLGIGFFFKKKDTMPKEVRHILLIQIFGIGDMVLSTSVVRAIKRRFPNARITTCIHGYLADLAKANRSFDHLIFFKPKHRRPFGKLRLFLEIRKGGPYDLSIDLTDTYLSAIISYLSRAPFRIGSNREGYGFLYTRNIKFSSTRHLIDNFFEIAGEIGVCGDKKTDLRLYVSPEDKRVVHDLLSRSGVQQKDLLVGIHPVGRNPARRWAPEKYAKVCNYINKEFGAKIVITGGGEDRQEIERILPLLKERPIITAGALNLIQQLALFERLALFITIDSGPMHMAFSVGTPIIALFGPGNVNRFGPHGPKNVIISKDLPCSPCSQFTPCKHPICMEMIEAEEVMDAARRQMKKLGWMT